MIRRLLRGLSYARRTPEYYELIFFVVLSFLVFVHEEIERRETEVMRSYWE